MTEMQLTLSVSLRDDATFANFYSLENELMIAELLQLVQGEGDSSTYLWGASGSGKSHCLQALCHACESNGRTAHYVPLSEHDFLSPDMLTDLEYADIITIDDIDAIAGLKDWEEGLFHLFNRVRDEGHRIVFSASQNIAAIGIALPDLRSRLSWGLNFHIKGLSEEEKSAALRLRAKNRGMVLTQEVVQFLLNHYSRDMTKLFHALDKLDKASLVEQRKITIPFIKTVLRV